MEVKVCDVCKREMKLVGNYAIRCSFSVVKMLLNEEDRKIVEKLNPNKSYNICVNCYVCVIRYLEVCIKNEKGG